MKDAIKMIMTIDLGQDRCKGKEYLNNRWKKHPINLIYRELRKSDTQEIKTFLNVIVSSAEVERVFSLMKWLLDEKKSFVQGNIIYYLRKIYEKAKSKRKLKQQKENSKMIEPQLLQ